MIAMRPGAELLLHCAQTRVDAEQSKRIRDLLQENIDWRYLTRMARMHGLAPLLYRNLNAACPDAVPKESLDQLHGLSSEAKVRNFFLTGELLALLSLFETHGITAIPFKGPVLAALIYGDLSLRLFRDLDILIHKQDFLRAKALLLSQGFQPELTGAPAAGYLQFHHAYPFVRKDGVGVYVDLQWEFAQPFFAFGSDLDQWWKGSQPVSFAGATVLSPSPEDWLLALCIHGSKHRWERLAWLCDVAELSQGHPQLDWDRVMAHARMQGSERMLLLGLSLARTLLKAPFPESVVQRTQVDPMVESLATQVREWLFCHEPGSSKGPQKFLFRLRMRERLWDRIRYTLYILVSPNTSDLAFLSLPTSLSFLYYLLRPVRVITEYGLALLRRLFCPHT